MNCIKCGHPSIQGSKFCEKCGNPISESPTESTPANIPEKSRGKKFLTGTTSGLIALLVFLAFRFLGSEGVNQLKQEPTKQEIIHEIVVSANQQATFPQELDEVTTFTGIEESTNAIRYNYTLHDVDENQIDSNALKNMLKPEVCQNSGTKNILDEDINLEYFYKVKNSITTYLITLTKSDCN